AVALQGRTGFAHINSDTVRKRLAGTAATAAAPATYADGLYTPEFTQRTYRTMLDEGAAHVAAGRGLILDATFQRRTHRDAVRALARRHGVPLLFVECHCDEAEIRRRLAERGRQADSISDADWAIYLEQRRHFVAFGSDELDDSVR